MSKLLQSNPGMGREGGLARSEADKSRVETEGWVYIVDVHFSPHYTFFLGSKLK